MNNDCEYMKISHLFLHRSAHIWVSYIHYNYSSFGWFIWTQHNDQLPIGLLAQLVERCTSIAEFMGSNPIQDWKGFSGLILTTSSVVFILVRILFQNCNCLWIPLICLFLFYFLLSCFCFVFVCLLLIFFLFGEGGGLPELLPDLATPGAGKLNFSYRVFL